MKAWNSFPLNEWKEDRTNSIEHRKGSWSLSSSCFTRGPSARVSMQRIGWMRDQLCRRAHLTFENQFVKILCTHHHFCHRFVLISSVLSYTLLRISILQNILLFTFSVEKIKANLNPQSHFQKCVGSVSLDFLKDIFTGQCRTSWQDFVSCYLL